jgi:PPOX class probable F420-dependent enzyme
MPTEIPASHKDLAESPVGALATIGTDGRPQVTAVWFLYDDGQLRISLNPARQKVRNLRLNPECAFFILDLANPYRYLEVRGDARIDDDPDYAFAQRIGRKYDADLRQMDGPGGSRVVVTIDPTRVNAVDLSG